MKKINIDAVIIKLCGIKVQKKMKKDFLKFAKKGEVGVFNSSKKEPKETKKQKENRKKYKKYDSQSKNMIKLKDDFFNTIQKSGIYFCCYCGKDRLTHFKEGGKYLRLYDIEHFLPRSKFPDLSVNLYNWLPVCMSCNQRLKGDQNPLGKKETFHPYFGFIDSKGYIIKKFGTLDKRYTFTLLDKKRNLIFNSEHSHFFQLYKIYLNSQDTFNDFQFIQHIRTKIKDEKMKLKKITKTNDEWVEYFFKNYYPEKEEDILKYSNGKLKKDLIKNLKL